MIHQFSVTGQVTLYDLGPENCSANAVIIKGLFCVFVLRSLSDCVTEAVRTTHADIRLFSRTVSSADAISLLNSGVRKLLLPASSAVIDDLPRQRVAIFKSATALVEETLAVINANKQRAAEFVVRFSATPTTEAVKQLVKAAAPQSTVTVTAPAIQSIQQVRLAIDCHSHLWW